MLEEGRKFIESLEEMLPEEERAIFELDDLLLEFSMMVLNYRVEQGLTQKQLAEHLGVSQAMVAKYECGNFNPSLKTIWEVSRKMGMKVQLGFASQQVEDNMIIGDLYEGVPEEDSDADCVQPERIFG